MGLFYKHEEKSAQSQPQYFTEVGLPNREFENRLPEITRDQFDQLCAEMRSTEAIYCPYSRRTGEPYLFMDVLKDELGYGFGKSRIQVWTESENDRLSPLFTSPDVEVVRIPAGEDGRGIPAFLGMAFYENGAEFVVINGVNFPLAAEMILPKPDLSRIPEHQRPLQNPQVMKWQCLLAQLTGQENPMVRDLDDLYLTSFAKALLSQKVLLPLLVENEKQFSVPAWQGREEREYVRVYTDWRRLYQGMDPQKQWSAKTEYIADLIKTYDIALNLTSFREFGIYITPSLFENLQSRLS